MIRRDVATCRNKALVFSRDTQLMCFPHSPHAINWIETCFPKVQMDLRSSKSWTVDGHAPHCKTENYANNFRGQVFNYEKATTLISNAILGYPVQILMLHFLHSFVCGVDRGYNVNGCVQWLKKRRDQYLIAQWNVKVICMLHYCSMRGPS